MSSQPRPIGLVSAWKLSTADRYALLEQVDDEFASNQDLLAYLRGGTVIFAIMEHTRDVIGDKFGRDGGSGIVSDGTFYWRVDAADYVEWYGVKPTEAFLDHIAEHRHPHALSPAEQLKVDSALWAMRSGSDDPARKGT